MRGDFFEVAPNLRSQIAEQQGFGHRGFGIVEEMRYVPILNVCRRWVSSCGCCCRQVAGGSREKSLKFCGHVGS